MTEAIRYMSARRVTIWNHGSSCVFDVEIDGYMVEERVTHLEMVQQGGGWKWQDEARVGTSGCLWLPSRGLYVNSEELRVAWVPDFESAWLWKNVVEAIDRAEQRHRAFVEELIAEARADTQAKGGLGDEETAGVGRSAPTPRGNQGSLA